MSLETMSILVGFNNILYDLAIIQTFRGSKTANPFSESKMYAKSVTSSGGKGQKGKISYFENIFILDLHYLRAGSLKKLIIEMKKQEKFSFLNEKNLLYQEDAFMILS